MAREFSEEWKSLLPIGGSTVSPLLFSDPHSIGPIFFNPNPNLLTPLFSSTIPSLSLPHHLLTERYLVSSDPSILPSTASSIATLFDSPIEVIDHNVSHFLHNRINLLKCRDSPNVVILFPAGANDESIGFFMLRVKDSVLDTRLDVKGNVFRASTGSKSRIFRMLVNAVTDSELGGAYDSSLVIGYLLASSLYSVCWFTVNHNLNMDSPSMSYLGTSKVFKETVVHACWSPHILEESLVLLESGQLFLFDLESQGSMNVFNGTRLRVPWSDWTVDLRLKECNVTCLMKIETLRMYAPNVNERFLALSRAGPDDFYFNVASSSLLVLCDVRKPLMPILQWKHNIDEPCYMNLLSLATLRSHSKVDNFKLASEMGFCIILGSFWNSEFNVFCYGPAVPFRKGSITSKLSKISTTFCAWELPSEVNLSSHECHCGICLFREDLSKDALPEWLKKEMVLGFSILSNDLASLLCEPDEHGGFTLVRITSSGRFELQRYHASWSLARKLEDKAYSNDQEEAPFSSEVHELLCKKLNSCGLGHSRSSPAITSIFNDVKLPASFHEVALRKLWTDLPLEFLAVPDLPQLPLFFSRKPSPHSDNDIVGPAIPFPVLLVINEVRYGYSDLGSDGFSVEAELDLKYKEVMQVANEIAASSHSSMPPDDHAVSLAEENEDPWADSSKPKPFSTYRPIALTFSDTDSKSCKQTESESVGAEMFDDLCPIEMRFDAPEKKFEDQSLKAYTYLKKKMSRWHEEFDLYKEFCIQSGFKKAVNS
ncbi:uncharacterized protein LOC131605215 [Vicia villosa]|uniref:uncharacterized protein LOC131605215 n=1 Tax=Vicia villosa TaxID=3911 RepID=UPI00273B7357|nr:uncharacterized protein LOC131605215 [Vicia villosa]